MKYNVTIRATVTKTIEVEAEDEHDASLQAHSEFSVECDDNEDYEQDTISITEGA